MSMLKKIALRLFLILGILILSNYIYKYTLYPQDIKVNGLLTSKLEYGLKHADILLFSASPNKAFPPSDTDRRSIAKITNDYLDNHAVVAIDTGAIHAGVFKKLISLIPDQNNLKYIIVNMNYRSFGISWIMSSLENSIAKQSVFYANRPLIINRFLQGLNYYDALPSNERLKIIQTEWKNKPLPFNVPKNNVTDWCAVEKWGDWTNPKRNLADNYIKQYAFVIDSNNVRVKDFDEIVDLCKQKNITLVFNILGENLVQTKYLIDSDLTDLMIENKNWLIKRYSPQGTIIVDNLTKIADSCFYERDFPTEHYSFEGRNKIAKSISEQIINADNIKYK